MSDNFKTFEKQEPELTEEQKEQHEKQEFFAALKRQFGDKAPTEEDLERWKAQCGRVRWLEFGPSEIYFFRPFKANEYKGWMQTLQSVAEKDPDQAEDLLRQRIVSKCVLFPKIVDEDMGSMYAGTVDTLYEMIRMASNFIPMQLASNLVREW